MYVKHFSAINIETKSLFKDNRFIEFFFFLLKNGMYLYLSIYAHHYSHAWNMILTLSTNLKFPTFWSKPKVIFHAAGRYCFSYVGKRKKDFFLFSTMTRDFQEESIERQQGRGQGGARGANAQGPETRGARNDRYK